MAIPPSHIQVVLETLGSDRRVPARLTFRNASRAKAFLYKVAACPNGEIKNNLFVIEGKEGKVRYKGRYYRRAAAKMPEDFIELAPGASFVVTVHLGDVYAFPPGRASYRARYEALDPSPPGEDLLEMKSAEIVVDLPD